MVSLGAAIAGALPGMRAEAESMMRDSCAITRPGGGETWDDATGGYLPGSTVTLYSGRCRIRRPNVAEREASAGDTDRTLMGAVVSIPVGGTTAVSYTHLDVYKRQPVAPRTPRRA